MEERMRFVLRLKDGECMSSLCREFGISRVTGYKIYATRKSVYLAGQRESISFKISSAQRTASAIALIVAGTRLSPS